MQATASTTSVAGATEIHWQAEWRSARSSTNGGRIRALSFNGVAPTAGNVESKAYPLVREAFFVTKTPTKEAVGRFVAFVVGPEGEKVIRANGALPLR